MAGKRSSPIAPLSGGRRGDSPPGLRGFAGSFASFVVHVILLLVLAFWIAPHDGKRRLAIEIDTTAWEEPPEFDDVPIELPVLEAESDPLEPEFEPAVFTEQPVDDVLPLVADLDLVDSLPTDLAAVVNETDVLADMTGVQPCDERRPARSVVGRGHGFGGRGRGDGFGGEVGRRLDMAGAQSGDVQVSLAWNNVNDIDLHVVSPSGERIYYGNRWSRCGGCLDVDMNIRPTTPRAVENVFWPHGRAPQGVFTVFVHHFRRHVRDDPTPFEVHVLVQGRKAMFRGAVASGQGPVFVAQFDLTGRGLPDGERAETASDNANTQD